MPRGVGKRTWIKLYPVDCLDGSIRYQLEPDERGVWYDLLNFSAICATPGSISDKDDRPFPHSFIANRLNIPLKLLESTLAKCLDEGRITENGQGIHITNWASYQSEYERQKPYRRKEGEVTENVPKGYTESYSKSAQVEVEEKVEKRRKEVKKKGDKSPSPYRDGLKQLFEGLKERRKYDSPKAAAEAKSAKWMLQQGYTVEQVFSCYDALKVEKFWRDKPLFLMSVQGQIGEWSKHGTTGEYTDLEEYRQSRA